MNEILTPAAMEMTRWSPPSIGFSSSSTGATMFGLTASMIVVASRTTSTFSAVTEMPRVRAT